MQARPQARLIAYPPDTAAVTRWLQQGERLRIGRAPECGLVLEHPSISRMHAEIQHDGRGWRLRDMDSKNGCHVDGIRVRDSLLPASCWLRLGDAHCEFVEYDAAQAVALREREDVRRARSQAMTRQMAQQSDVRGLLDEILHGVIELAGCSRGFLLLADGDEFRVRAARLADGETTGTLDSRAFPGSVGAVQRALRERKPVVVNHVSSEAWLARRDSVDGSGLQSLICLPLFNATGVIGAVYADRHHKGEPITRFDLELLDAFAETAALWLLARQALRSLDDAPRWSAIVAGASTGPHAVTTGSTHQDRIE